MVSKKSLDDPLLETICTLLHNVHTLHGAVFNRRDLRLTLNKVNRRLHQEGHGFLTKTLPRLGKAFDKALAGEHFPNSASLGFKPLANSKLPRFLGEFFVRVLSSDGDVLPEPCIKSVAVLRLIFGLFYKYEEPYTEEQEQQVINGFKQTEDDLSTVQAKLDELIIKQRLANSNDPHRLTSSSANDQDSVIRRARALLSDLFSGFDPFDIVPRHGPGAVSTRERLWNKFLWTNVASKITNVYPLDAYFFASLSHVCDRSELFNSIGDQEHPARVCLVPKDSRGPRLISCEPVDFQWIQQGLGRALVELVERHEKTRYCIHFTDQGPNQRGALLGSLTGGYATLDLKEASDRVTVSLVRLLFPEHICVFLEACRSSSTELPSGEVLKLKKFAPMGSCLCFPVMAITIWAILAASAPDQHPMPSRGKRFYRQPYEEPSLLVYGDDVVVPTAQAENAIEQLESFGLKVNRDKSCTKGHFRESCGVDAFKGVNVTPIRIRTVWSSEPSPDVYTSWISYANSFYDRQYFEVYDKIVERLIHTYGPIPDESMHLACPSLREVSPEIKQAIRRRSNVEYQKLQYRVWDTCSPKISFESDAYAQLLRYYTERCSSAKDPESYQQSIDRSWIPLREALGTKDLAGLIKPGIPLPRVSVYTRPNTSKLVRRWR